MANGKYYFECTDCKEVKKGDLEKQVIDFKEKQITNIFRCDDCNQQTVHTTKMAKDTTFK